jgi:flagellar biosynthesis repressor protein FlbT
VARPRLGAGRRYRQVCRILKGDDDMPLRVELKPFERIVIGESVIINSGNRTSFLIDGDVPILRDKDTVTAETANTPATRLYYCVQVMYLKNDVARYRTSYLASVDELRRTVPGSGDMIDAVDQHISAGALYKALKEIRKLIRREEELVAV